MQLGDKESLGLLAAIGGWLATVFVRGRRVGKIEARFEATENTVATHDAAIQKLREHHDEDMRQIREFFATASGGQKFITFPDHDAICERNNKLTLQAVGHLTDVIKENTAQVALMGDKMHLLQVSVAVLKERRSGNHPRPDNSPE